MNSQRWLLRSVGVTFCLGVLASTGWSADGLPQGTVEKSLEQAKLTGMPILAVAGRKT